MGDDDDGSRWSGKLKSGAKAPASGVTKELMRRARQLNPALAEQGSTTDLFNKMKDAEAKGGKTAATSAPAEDLVTALDELERTHAARKERVKQQIEALQNEAAAITPATLERLLDLILAIDPNMVSPQTQEMMRDRAAFLNEIGFSVRKLIDRKLKKKSGR